MTQHPLTAPQQFDPHAPVGVGGTTYYGPPEPRATQPVEAPRYSCDMPPSRFLMSLTGFDEIAIGVRFGQKINDLREDAVTAGRALAFVHKRRLGATDPEAYEAAMSLTMQEIVDYFAPEPKEQLEDEVTLLNGETMGARAEGN